LRLIILDAMKKKKQKYWQSKAFKKKQADMIKFLTKELTKKGYSVKEAN
jgi:hypothetical protein